MTIRKRPRGPSDQTMRTYRPPLYGITASTTAKAGQSPTAGGVGATKAGVQSTEGRDALFGTMRYTGFYVSPFQT